MGPLDGVKILELAPVPPGEFCAMLLADMGAEVLKIEAPPRDGEAEPADDPRRAVFTVVNRNKRSLALNLKSPEGQEIFQRLAASADVIIEGFRPGVMNRLGAAYETIKAFNPRVIYLDTTLSLLAATPHLRFFFRDGIAPRRGEGILGGSYLLSGHWPPPILSVRLDSRPVPEGRQPRRGPGPAGDRFHHQDAES